MRIKITGGGIYSANNGRFMELPIGLELEVSKIPTGWANRCKVIADGRGKTPIVNPDVLDHDKDGEPGGSLPADERGLDDLRDQAESVGIKVDKRWGEPRLKAEIEKAQ